MPAAGHARYAVLLVAYIAIVLVGLLAPFDTGTPNDVRWTVDGDGLELRGGVVRSVTRPTKLHERLVTSGQLSVEVSVSTDDRHQEGPARIVSYSDSTRWRNFALAQDGRDLVVRLRTTRTNLNGSIPHVVVKGVFERPGSRDIVVTYDGAHERIYVNGALALTTDEVQGSFVNWNPDHWLVVGNEHTATRPWRGVIRRLAIYDRALAADEIAADHAGGAERGPVALYNFRPGGRHVSDQSGLAPRMDLHIPDVVEPTRGMLTVSMPDAFDLVVNLALFVPVGFLTMFTLRGRGATMLAIGVATVGFAAGLSFTAEVLQHFVVSRASELSDVVLNTAGAAMGGCLAFFSARFSARYRL